jgi:hypothetical protein
MGGFKVLKSSKTSLKLTQSLDLRHFVVNIFTTAIKKQGAEKRALPNGLRFVSIDL